MSSYHRIEYTDLVKREEGAETLEAALGRAAWLSLVTGALVIVRPPKGKTITVQSVRRNA